jgi:hypothetical protein
LVSTGQLFAGEAVLMIEHMEKIGKIEKTERYNIYRKRGRLLKMKKGELANGL